MKKIAKFHKVSYSQFEQDYASTFPEDTRDIKEIYEHILLPKRATKGSAGYDFYSPIPFRLAPQETIKIPTGIRVEMQEGWVLTIHPRSSLGFTYRLQMDNTTGIIDEDYFYSDNEGHIFVKLTNNTNTNKEVVLQQSDAIVQGIFLPFGICEDDEATTIRNGGFGSTSK